MVCYTSVLVEYTSTKRCLVVDKREGYAGASNGTNQNYPSYTHHSMIDQEEEHLCNTAKLLLPAFTLNRRSNPHFTVTLSDIEVSWAIHRFIRELRELTEVKSDKVYINRDYRGWLWFTPLLIEVIWHIESDFLHLACCTVTYFAWRDVQLHYYCYAVDYVICYCCLYDD